jgi:hypothetical protein
MARLRDDADWDWWREWEWPPGPLREFNPADWPGFSEAEQRQQFTEARWRAAPNGWIIHRLRRKRAARRRRDCPDLPKP